LVLELFIDAFQTRCKRCTEKQKELFEKLCEWYIKNEPKKWVSMIAKIVEDAQKKTG